MKKINKKLLLVSVLCLAMFAFFGCSDEPEAEPEVNEAATIHEYEDIAAAPETFEDYLKATEIIDKAFTYAPTDLQNRLAEIDTNDAAAVQTVVDTVKKPFVQFMALTPPAEYEAANADFVKACELTISYIEKTAAGEDAAADHKAAQEAMNAAITAVADVMLNQ